ncbi:MAG: hypothetical protein WCO88_15405 [Actinomycetota bacterium]
MTESLSTHEAFEAMRRLLAAFNEREPIERRVTIEQLLRWTEVQADGATFDPAQWDDWLSAVEEAKEPRT